MDEELALVDTATLRESVAELEADVQQTRERIAELQAVLQAKERELALLVEVLRLRGEPMEMVLPSIRAEAMAAIDGELVPSQNGTRANGAELTDAVVDILRGRGVPTPIQDLLTAVTERGVKIPGQGKAANLIAHIASHPEIVRTGRGVYGLKELGHKTATIAKRTRTGSKRGSSNRQARTAKKTSR